MQQRLIGLVILAAVVLGGFAYWQYAHAPAGTVVEEVGDTPIKINMGYIPNVQFAPFYAADSEGFYQAAGIDPTFEHGFTNDILTLLGAGEERFAITDGDQVVLARSQGIPVRAVLALYPEAPVGLMSLSGSGLTPDNLAGKTIGLPGLYGTSYHMLLAWLAAVGVDETAVTLEAIGYSQVETLAAGSVDAVVVFLNNEPLLAADQGLAVELIDFRQQVSFAGAVLATNDQTLSEQSALVGAVVSATREGMRWVWENPVTALERMRPYVPEVSDADWPGQMPILTASIDLWRVGESATFGELAPAIWAQTYDSLAEQNVLGSAYDVSAAYVNLEAISTP